MPVYSKWYIPLSSLSVTNGTNSIFGDTGSPFPDDEIGNLAASFNGLGFSPATLTWDGTGRTRLKINDDDGVFNDDNDTTQTLAESFAGFLAGTLVETQYSYTLSGNDGSVTTVYAVNFAGDTGSDQVYGLVATTPLVPGVTYTITNHFPIADAPYSSLACFCAGTMIDTPTGAVRVDALRVGDMVLTRDNGPQPIRWIGSSGLSASDMAKNPNLRPIHIRAGALGFNMPNTDLHVSPQHRILISSKIAQRMFDRSEVLVAAKQLCAIEGVNIVEPSDEVTYYHMMFDQHEVITSNGTPTESLFTGPEALKALSRDAIREIFALFPDLHQPSNKPDAARYLVPGRTGRKLAERHAKNAQPLIM